MDDLNQRQLVLLVILVSFVTSIATGIMTVSLLDHAPASVTQSVNRVVERTVEHVTPTEVQKTEVTEVREVVETKIVERGDELIVEAEERLRPASLMVINSDGSFRSRGVAVSSRVAVLPFPGAAGTVRTVWQNGERIDVELVSSHDGFSFAEITAEDAEFAAASFANETPRRGTSVLHIGGGEGDELFIGRITRLDIHEGGSLLRILTDRPPLSAGGLLGSLEGTLLGMKVEGQEGYISSEYMHDVLKDEDAEGSESDEENDDEEEEGAHDETEEESEEN